MVASILLSLAACGDEPVVAPSVAPPVAPVAPPFAPPPVAEVPDGFTVISEATGDLTGDGTPDHVAVLGREAGGEWEATLRITLGDAGSAPIEASHAVCASCGGMKGAPVPFEVELNAETRVLTLTSTGGSREMWSRATKWRYQNAHFELIGVEDNQYDTLAEAGMVQSITRSVNLSTHKMTEDVETIGAAKATTECPVPGNVGVIDLATFANETFVTPQCTDRAVE